MFDLHIHSTLSDGELIPAEIARRYRVLGYKAIAITDHADNTNLEFILSSLVNACEELSKYAEIEVIAGVELTHVPPKMIEKLVNKARRLGAKIIIVHGETIVEPVAKGTNLAAVSLPEVDILAHPGLITIEEAELARENDVYLELSARKGHCLTNGYVARIAKEAKAKLILNTDAHSPSDILSLEQMKKIVLGSGLSEEDSRIITSVNPESLISSI